MLEQAKEEIGSIHHEYVKALAKLEFISESFKKRVDEFKGPDANGIAWLLEDIATSIQSLNDRLDEASRMI